MVISHKYKCIFVKVPKTAGTAIYRFFEKHDPESIRGDIEHCPWSHITAEDIKNDHAKEVWDTYFKFAFIREPLSWLVSLYNYEHGYDYSEDRYKTAHILLQEGRLRIPDDLKLNIFDVITVMMLPRRLLNYPVPQTTYLTEPLDFIGVYENIEEDFNFIKKRLGIPLDLQLSKTNVTRFNRPLKFTEKAEKVTKILLSEDIALYNAMYQKLDNPEERSMGTSFSYPRGISC
jgi:hypothetical protein